MGKKARIQRDLTSLGTKEKVPDAGLLASTRFQVVILFTVTIFIYGFSTSLGWIWDDEQYVYANPLLLDLKGLYRIWFDPSATPQYYPAVFTTLWLEYQVFGPTPSGFHLVNTILHACNVLLCFQILRKLEITEAFWIAIAFAIHPIQVESVAWITEIKNLQSGLFYGLAWLAFWPIVTSPEPSVENVELSLSNRDVLSKVWSRAILGIVLFLLALGSKSVTATLPAAMLVAVWYRDRSCLPRAFKFLIPLLLLGALVGWNTARIEATHVGAYGAEWGYGWLVRLGIASQAWLHYLGQVAVPLQQIFFYPRFSPEINAQASVSIGCVAFMFAIAGFVAVRGRRGLLAALLFFTGSAFPALGFLNVYPHRFSFVADHFVYLPSIGLFCIVIVAIERLCHRLSFLQVETQHWRLQLVYLLLTAWYATLTLNYLPVFRNEISLWQDTLAKNPNSVAAMQNLGLAYYRKGDLDAADSVLRNAIEYEFDRYQSWNSLGLVLAKADRIPDAIDAFEESLKLNPDSVRGWINLANSLRALDLAENTTSRREPAIDAYLKAWACSENYTIAFGLGIIYFESDDFANAEVWFTKACGLEPNDVDARYNLARVVYLQGRDAEARKLVMEFMKEFPQHQFFEDLMEDFADSSPPTVRN